MSHDPGSPQPWGQPPGAPPPGPPPGPPSPQQPPQVQQQSTPPTPGPQWQQLPPEELARMHQPGVIPLRPLALADIFSGSLMTLRRNPRATIGLGLLVQSILLVPTLLLITWLYRSTSINRLDLLTASEVTSTLLAGFGSLLLSGFVIHVISEAALGDRAGLGQTWQAVRGRIPALIGLTLLNALIIILGVLLVVLLAILLGAFTLGIGALLVALLAIPAFLYLIGRLALAPAAVVLERLGPMAALGRGWRLTTGASVWRVLGILLLAGIVTSIFSLAVGVPINALLQVLAEAASADLGRQVLYVSLGSAVLSVVVDAVVTPFTAGVTALLYLDQRIRREGLDGPMMQAAQERSAARRS